MPVRLKDLKRLTEGYSDWFGVNDTREETEILSDSPVEFQRGVISLGEAIPGFPHSWYRISTFSSSAGRREFLGIPKDHQGDPQSTVPTRSKARFWLPGVTLPPAPTPGETSAVTATDILQCLRQGRDGDGLRAAILEAELVEFDDQQATELVGVLRAFIDRFRSGKDEATTTAVCAAIRSYVAMIPVTRMDEVASLLNSTVELPPIVENEIAKMTVRKLTANPPDQDDGYPQLSTQLADLAISYLNPRMVSREFYGPAAMNAALATALIRTGRFRDVFGAVTALPVGWFKQQLGRRAARIAAELTQQYPADQVAIHRHALERLTSVGNHK